MSKPYKPISAVAVFTGPKIKGIVHFIEDSNPNSNLVHIKINLEGLGKNTLHGFHVHESGDLTDKC